MKELLEAQLELAEGMMRVASRQERPMWVRYHDTIQAQLAALQRPPRVRPPVDPNQPR